MLCLLLEGLCVALRHCRHGHSRYQGELASEVGLFDLVKDPLAPRFKAPLLAGCDFMKGIRIYMLGANL
jgi:hypothetical protein